MSDELVDTGLTAAVTTAAQLPAPYHKAPMPEGWNLNKVSALVRDIAHNMYDLPVILQTHGLTQQQYATLEQNEFFKRALEQFTLDWNTAENTEKRLRLEAAIAVEAALPAVAARAHKPTEPLSDVVALVKLLSEMAGVTGARANVPQATSEKFKIVINLGADTLSQDVRAPGAIQVLDVSQGQSNVPAVQPFLEASGVPAHVLPFPKG